MIIIIGMIVIVITFIIIISFSQAVELLANIEGRTKHDGNIENGVG